MLRHIAMLVTLSVATLHGQDATVVDVIDRATFRPLAEARVTVETIDGRGRSTWTTSEMAGDASATIALGAGVRHVRFEAAGYVSQTLAVATFRQGRRQSVSLEPALTLRGRLVDESTGGGVAGDVLVGYGSSRQEFHSVRTTPGGDFVLEVPAGRLRIVSRADGYSVAQVILEQVPTAAQQLLLKRSGTIAGVLLDANGEPIERGRVKLLPLGDRTPFGTEATTYTGGQFVLQSVAADTAYDVVASGQGCPAKTVSRVRLAAGEQRKAVRWVLADCRP